MRGEILEFQDKLLAAHYPAVSATSQRKRLREDSDTCGGSLLGGSTLTTPTGTWTYLILPGQINQLFTPTPTPKIIIIS